VKIFKKVKLGSETTWELGHYLSASPLLQRRYRNNLFLASSAVLPT
jgi:hypothetical protein